MHYYKSLNMLNYFKSIYKSVIFTGLSLFICFLLQVQVAQAITTSTKNDGAWGDSNNWTNGVPGSGDVANINHLMTFAGINLNMGNGAVYNFNIGASGSAIPLALSMEDGASPPVLNIYSNISFAGGINLNKGTIHVFSPATLTVTHQINHAGTQIIVEAGANFNVTGDYLNNGGNLHVDGLVSITGSYNGQNAAATVTGNGNILTTGHMIGINLSTIFGVVNPYCSPGGCDGRNLAGSGCNKVATVTPSITIACTGTLVNLSSAISDPTPYMSYQWQSKSINGNYIDIPGATSSSYSESLATTKYFRIIFYTTQNNGETSCTTHSIGQLVSVNACVNKWIGGTAGHENDWNTAANWTMNAVPTSTQDVIILVTSHPPILTSVGSYNVNGLAIEFGATLIINDGNTLNVNGDILANGPISINGTSTINFVGSTSQTISGITSLSNVTLNNSAGLKIQSQTLITGTLTLTSGILTTNSYVTIDFTSGGNIAPTGSGSISGLVTGSRTAVAARTHYIATPFSGVTSAQVAATTPLYVGTYWKLYTRTFSTQNWAAVTNTTTSMPLGTGFSLSMPSGNSALSFTGSYDPTFTFTTPIYSNAPTATDKYIFVGNPYPSTLDWDNATGWTKIGVGNAIYLWDAATATAKSYNGVGTNEATQYIPAMQAFLVATTGTGSPIASVHINNNARVSLQNPSFYRVSNDDIIRIKVKGQTAATGDETVIRFNEDATTEFDPDFDAYKIPNGGAVPSIYSVSGETNYSINTLPNADVQNIPLSLKLLADGNYAIEIAVSNSMMEYVLLDKKLGTENLISGPAYSFSGLKADDADRFELQLRKATTTGISSSTTAAGLQIMSSNKGFVIQSDRFVGENATIEILDVAGKLVQGITNENLGSNSTFIPLDLAEGAYIVRVNIQNSNFVQLISLTKQ